MKYDDKTHKFMLDNGRTLHGNGRHRLAPQGDGDISYGYDGNAVAWSDDPRFTDENGWQRSLTKDERSEVARYMIEAWQRWAETGEP